MDKDFIELLEKVFPDGTGTTKAYNANEKITEEDLIELSKIGRADYGISCDIMRTLIEKVKGDDKTVTIPILYRKAIFFIAYRLYNDSKTEGVQSKVLNDLGLAHNSFTKWDMKPIRDYKEGHDWGADIKLQRDGKKNDTLLFLLDGIVSQVKHKKIVDVFGGLGAVITSRPIRQGTKGYINDFDKSMANLLATIKYKPKELEELCREKLKEIGEKKYKEIFDDGKKVYQKRIYKQDDDKVDAFLCGVDDIEEEKGALVDDIKYAKDREELEYALGLQIKFREEVKKYQKSKTEEEEKIGFVVTEDKVDLEMALACYYLYGFTYMNGSSATGVNAENLEKFRDNISRISNYSERFKNVQVSCCDFKVILEDEEINSEDTLVYSDSPYWGTKSYAEKFSDKQHRQLHDSLKEFKGKWVFSCRDEMTNNSVHKDKKDGDVKIDNLLEYFEMYADIAKYVAYPKRRKLNRHEIMITNFDFTVPNIETLKSHKAEARGTKNRKEKFDIDGERGYTKETYDEFLARIRKSFDESKKIEQHLM